ncbi:MAG: hypothetical protein DRZ79_04015 [Candidatus Cloacimonadota bacterium]|nr:MAG: hypothetical protein DRZ79_04015 [Candidatus Cloacimonadota bacterium]
MKFRPPQLNELTLFFLTFIYLVPVLLSENILLNFLLLILAFINIIFFRKIRFKHLGLLVLFLIIPLISLFVTVLIYAKGAENSPILAEIFGFEIKQIAFNNALFLVSRTFCLSMISFLFLLSIRYDALVFALMQNLKLPVSIGYSLLATFNAFAHLKEEFSRIRLAYKMRFLKKVFPLKLLMPMLVSASRFAYSAGLSMESRGLNKQKTFLELVRWRKSDIIIIIANFIEIVILVGIFIFSGKFSVRLV